MTVSDSDGILADVHSWTWLHWVGILLSVGIAAVNVFVGYTADEQALFGVGCSFLLGVGLFCTRFWRPVFYVVGLLHIATLGVLWLLSGMRFFGWGLVSGALSIGLGGVILYLLFAEETAATDA